MTHYPTLVDVQAAAARIKSYVHRTPVLTCTSLNDLVGAELFCKCENFQKVGAFEFRGACNTVFGLSDQEAQHGVATHSSGNHAAAVALAARLRSVPAHIVMPDNAPAVKKAAVAGYGGSIVYCAPTLAAREATLERVVHETGATFIHPYNDARVVAGQGTAALELLTDVADLDVVMAPVGGGGLLSGTAIVTVALSPFTRVIAAEPEAADDAYRSLQAGKILPADDPRTIADGLRTSLGELTFANHSAACAADRHRERGGHRERHALRLGTHENRHRALSCCPHRSIARKEGRPHRQADWRHSIRW